MSIPKVPTNGINQLPHEPRIKTVIVGDIGTGTAEYTIETTGEVLIKTGKTDTVSGTGDGSPDKFPVTGNIEQR